MGKFYFSVWNDLLIITNGSKSASIRDAVILNKSDPVLNEIAHILGVKIEELVELLCSFYKFFPRKPG